MISGLSCAAPLIAASAADNRIRVPGADDEEGGRQLLYMRAPMLPEKGKAAAERSKLTRRVGMLLLLPRDGGQPVHIFYNWAPFFKFDLCWKEFAWHQHSGAELLATSRDLPGASASE